MHFARIQRRKQQTRNTWIRSPRTYIFLTFTCFFLKALSRSNAISGCLPPQSGLDICRVTALFKRLQYGHIRWTGIGCQPVLQAGLSARTFDGRSVDLLDTCHFIIFTMPRCLRRRRRRRRRYRSTRNISVSFFISFKCTSRIAYVIDFRYFELIFYETNTVHKMTRTFVFFSIYRSKCVYD